MHVGSELRSVGLVRAAGVPELPEYDYNLLRPIGILTGNRVRQARLGEYLRAPLVTLDLAWGADGVPSPKSFGENSLQRTLRRQTGQGSHCCRKNQQEDEA